ncbi:MAG TPA: sulfite exporter TauE/SafE family protein [Burkholderiaceae bacterium]|nr:sulfite exporter TauE/SafE family protein [Burkholderiaceae bacterium]HQR71915.1 sulfite exporter TauE/SafE family protein [Burkholderiaceae bacterium]
MIECFGSHLRRFIPSGFGGNGATRRWAPLMLAALVCPELADAATGSIDASAATTAWWFWPLALFVVCFFLGIIAVPAGVGGGVLFVPLVSGFFPFHLDYVRGAGLLVALSSALAAGPSLLRAGLANMRVALPLALIASFSAMIGALLGLALPASVVRIALGIAILGIVAVMLLAKKAEHPDVPSSDRLAILLGMHGVFTDGASGQKVEWRLHRTPQGLALFFVIGVLAGMFGLGAGWANVPALNLVMGAPLKVAAGSSSFILSLVDSSAAWIYLNNGAVLPVIAAPSIIGMMLGAKIGARLLTVLRASIIRRLVIGMLIFAGGRALMVGLGIGG